MSLFLDAGDRIYQRVMNRNSIYLLHDSIMKMFTIKLVCEIFHFCREYGIFSPLIQISFRAEELFFLVTWYQNYISKKNEKRQYNSLKSFSFFLKELSINLHDSCVFSISF